MDNKPNRALCVDKIVIRAWFMIITLLESDLLNVDERGKK
jgi:hypothetical protein